MTTLITQNFETGTDGATVTSGSTGNTAAAGQNPVSSVGGTPVFTAAYAIEGNLSLLCQNATSTTPTLAEFDFAVTNQIGLLVKCNLPTVTANSTFLAIRNNSGTAVLKLAVLTAGTIRANNSSGTTFYVTPSTLPLPETIWVSVALNVGTSTTDGTLSLGLYDTSGNLVGGMTAPYSGTGLNMGAGVGVRALQIGRCDTITEAGRYVFDHVLVNDSGTLPAVPSTAAPTAAFTSSTSNLTANVNGTGSSATTGASITAYDWNWGDSTTHGTGSTTSHTYSAAGTYTVTLTVTDSNGATNAVSHSVTVTAPSSGGPVTTLVTQNFESGTDGVAITSGSTGNTASPGQTPVSSVGGAPVFTSTYAIEGSVSMMCQVSTATSTLAEFDFAVTNQIGVLVKCNLPTVTANSTFLAIRNNSGTAVLKLAVLTAGTIRANNAAGATVYTTPSALTLPATIWVSAAINVGTTTTDGTLKLALYDTSGNFVGGMTAPYNGTGLNMGAGTGAKALQVGHCDAVVEPGRYVIDHVLVDNSGVMPSLASPNAAFVDTVSYLTVSVDGTSSTDPAGTINTYDWDWGDGTAHGANATATHTYAAAGTYTITLTVTDIDGLASTTTGTVTTVAPPASGFFVRHPTLGWVRVMPQIKHPTLGWVHADPN